ncbi:MAG: hypothetical protein ABJA79_03930 [Parafilimonas sp.]
MKKNYCKHGKKLSNTQKFSVIHLLKSFIEEDDEAPMSPKEINDYNKEIEEAELRISQGKFTEHEDILKKLKQWQK